MFDVVLFQEGQEFSLKILLPVVLILVCDVGNGRLDLGLAN